MNAVKSAIAVFRSVSQMVWLTLALVNTANASSFQRMV